MKFNNQKIFVWVVTISVLGCIVPEPPSALAVHESGVESEQSHGFVQQGILEPADGLAHDRLGHAVAISGDTVIVGAPRDDVGANTDQGSAYIFVRSGTTWIQQAKLTPDDGEAFELFGGSVAISGNTVIVGAESDDVGSNPNQGSAYVFARSGTTWLQQAKLTALDGSADDRFGVSVAISGLTAIVGSYEDDVGTVSDQGSAYVYVRSIATPIWSQQAKLTFLDGEANDNFGASVGISGSTAVVGVPVDTIGANLAQGSACVFVRSGTTWSQQGRLVANDGAAGDAFGLSLGISGDTVIAGAVLSDLTPDGDQGAAYVFVRSGAVWTQTSKLIASDGQVQDSFGHTASISGDTVIIGAPEDDSNNQLNAGSAYIFSRSGSTWTQRRKLGNTLGGDRFGFSVAITGGLAVVGSPFSDRGPIPDQGKAFTFVSSTPFDFDADGKTDIGIFRPSVGEWWVSRSSNGSILAGQFGATTDRIVPGDYTGDGKTDIAVWRPATGEWFVLRSEDSSFFAFPFGTNGDIPIPADYDGNGESEPAVFRPSVGTWFIHGFGPNDTTFIMQFGSNGDIPVPANYDGIVAAHIAIYRPSNGQWWITRPNSGDVLGLTFGNAADKPVPGDYTGDGKADVAVWRPSTGEWFILRSENLSFFGFPFGTIGDIPAPGDYDGDGKFDATVFRPSNGTWFSQRSTAGILFQQFGTNGDRPIPNAFVP